MENSSVSLSEVICGCQENWLKESLLTFGKNDPEEAAEDLDTLHTIVKVSLIAFTFIV